MGTQNLKFYFECASGNQEIRNNFPTPSPRDQYTVGTFSLSGVQSKTAFQFYIPEDGEANIMLDIYAAGRDYNFNSIKAYLVKGYVSGVIGGGGNGSLSIAAIDYAYLRSNRNNCWVNFSRNFSSGYYYIYLIPESSSDYFYSTTENTSCIYTPPAPPPEQCSIPTNIKLNNYSMGIDDSVTLSWGASYYGNVSEYEIKIINNSTGRQYTPTSIYTSYTINASLYGKKGQTLRISVKAVSSDGYSYDSPYSSEITCNIINTPPTRPNLSSSGIIKNTSSTITISGIRSSDSDYDTLYFYIQATSSRSTPSSNWISLGTSVSNGQHNLTGLTPDQHFIHVKVSDGDTAVYSMVEASYEDPAPEITSFSCQGENIPIVNPSLGTATRTLTIRASFNKQVKYSVYLKFPNSGYISLISSSSYVTSINTTPNIETAGSSYRGQRINVKITIQDSSGRSSSREISTNSILATLPTSVSSVSGAPVESDFYVPETDNYLGKNIKISFSIPGQKDTDIPWSKIEIGMTSTSNSYVALGQYNFTDSKLPINVTGSIYSIENKLNNDYKYKPTISIIDQKGRKSALTSSQIFQILPILKISSSSNSSVNLTEWKIYENNTLSFSLQNLTPVNGTARYHIYGQVEGGGRYEICTFKKGDPNVNIAGDTIIYNINGLETLWNVFKKLRTPSNQPKKKIYYTARIENNAKVLSPEYYSIKGIYYIETQTSPIWIGTAIMKRGYGNITNEKLPDISGDGKNSAINDNELLSVEFSDAPEDKNDLFFNGVDESQQQTLRKISLEYFIDSDSNLVINDSNATNYNWITFSGAKNQEDIYGLEGFLTKKVFQIILPNLSVPKDKIYYLYIRAKVEDDTNRSFYKYCTNNLIAGRSNKATYLLTIPANEAKYDEVTSVLDLKLNFQYSDYGGNNSGYENFNRIDSPGSSKLIIKCAGSLEELETAEEKIYEDSSNFIPQITDGRINFHFNNIKLTNKLYLQSKLEVKKSKNDLSPIITENAVITLYLNGPTISVRSHSIGINEGNINIDSAVTISSFNEKRYISLKGLKDSSPIEIKIDLNTGEIYGAIISGGSWD